MEWLVDSEDECLLATTWEQSVQLAVASRFADGPRGGRLRILLGVGELEDDYDFVGLDDPGGVAEAVVTLARRIAREGTYKAVAHWVECDDGASRGIVEVVADLT